MEPADYSKLSENGSTKVKVTAPNKELDRKSKILVYARNGDDWKLKWKAEAINKVEPTKPHVSDDGAVVVRLGNWYGKDEGNDELLVYRHEKVLRHYSVDELLGGHFRPSVYSTGGSEWLHDSIAFFAGDNQFCVWVDFMSEWVLVNTEDGGLVKPTLKDLATVKKRARELAYAKMRGGENYARHYRVIARFLEPEDKPVFEKLLTEPFDSIRQNLEFGDLRRHSRKIRNTWLFEGRR